MIRIFGMLTNPTRASREQVETIEFTTGSRDSGPVLEAPSELAPINTPPETLSFCIPAERPNRTSVRMARRGPHLFQQSNYVVAVRASNRVVLSQVAPSKPAEVIEMYVTGFPRAASGGAAADLPSADSATVPVTVSIGDTPADVHFAGRAAPGLFQIDVTVPQGLPRGDYPVIVSIAGRTTKGSPLLRVANPSES